MHTVFCLSLLLIAALGVLIGFAFKELIHRIFPGPISRAFDCTNYCCVTLVRWVAFRLFGLHSQKKINPDTTRPSDDWSGRLNYLESTFEKIVENAKKDLIGEITALETVRPGFAYRRIVLYFEFSRPLRLYFSASMSTRLQIARLLNVTSQAVCQVAHVSPFLCYALKNEGWSDN